MKIDKSPVFYHIFRRKTAILKPIPENVILNLEVPYSRLPFRADFLDPKGFEQLLDMEMGISLSPGKFLLNLDSTLLIRREFFDRCPLIFIDSHQRLYHKIRNIQSPYYELLSKPLDKWLPQNYIFSTSAAQKYATTFGMCRPSEFDQAVTEGRLPFFENSSLSSNLRLYLVNDIHRIS